ncbi:MAG: RNA-binding domain-containing protein [Nitrosopumilaceae archaeon]
MKTPDFNCKIDAYCTINSSEDQTKVEQAISNILPDIEIQINDDSLKATSQNLETLSNIFEVIHSRKIQRVYRRFLNNNLRSDSTWFYLNKQAAFSNTVALCDEAEESPLGPIKIVLTSKNIEDIIDWLVSEG